MSIIDKQNSWVHACSLFGTFFGTWCSPLPPELKSYVVELDSNDFVSPNAISFSATKQPNVESRNGATYLTGLLEEIEGMLMFLRIGADLVMLEMTHNSDYSNYVGHFVQVELSELLVYDIGPL